MKSIVIASRNKGKIKEFKQLFKDSGITVYSLDDLETTIPEIEETGTTFHENAQIKAEKVASIIQTPVIADDSGLMIDALDGRPGVYSARYAGEPTDDVQNYEKVLKEMEHVAEEDRTARFVAVLALARPGEATLYFEGRCEGKISDEPKGDFGFGYDPIFIPKESNKTMAQLPADEKNKISHRYQALKQLQQWIREHS